MFTNVYDLTVTKTRYPVDSVRIHFPKEKAKNRMMLYFIPYQLAHGWGFTVGSKVEVLISDQRDIILIRTLKDNKKRGAIIKKINKTNFINFRTPEVKKLAPKGGDFIFGPDHFHFKTGLYLYFKGIQARMDKAMDKMPDLNIGGPDE